MLFVFSSNLLHVFLPLYLLKSLHFPLWLALSPIGAAILSYGALSFFGYEIQKRIGTKKFFAIHLFFELIHKSFLFLIPQHNWAFWAYLALAPLTGLFSVWQPYQVYLTKYTQTNCRGLQLSIQSIATLLVAAFGTMAGSAILNYLGFLWIVGIQYVFTILRVVPIIMMDTFYEPQMKWRFVKVLKLMFSKRFRKTTIAQAGIGIIETGNFLWPIFIYLSLKSYLGVGSVISVALLFQVIFTLTVGRLTDTLGRKIVLIVGTFLNSLVWFGRFVMRFLPKNILIFLGIETYASFVGATVGLPYTAVLYDKAERDLDYRPLFDLMNHVGSVLSMLAVIVLLYVFPALENYLYLYFLICAIIIYFLPLIYNNEK